MAGTEARRGGRRGASRARTTRRPHPIRHDARVRGSDLPRGRLPQRTQPRAGVVRDALLVDDQSLPRMHPRLHVLLRPWHAHLSRARRRSRLRHADRRQDEYRRCARARSTARGLEPRARRPGHQHRSVSAGGGPLPPHAGNRVDTRRVRHPAVDPHEGNAASPRPRSAGGCRRRRAGLARDVDRGLRRGAPAHGRAGNPDRRRTPRDRACRGGGRLRGHGSSSCPCSRISPTPSRCSTTPSAASARPGRRAWSSVPCTPTGGEALVPAVARARASRARRRLCAAVSRYRRQRTEGVPHLARAARAPAAARTPSRRGPEEETARPPRPRPRSRAAATEARLF